MAGANDAKGRARILIVEDDVAIAFGLERNLRYEGYEVQVATDGERGLDAQLAEWRPPFWVRVLPFVPDLFTRPRLFVLAITDRRVVVIRLTNPHFGNPKPNGVKVSIPLAELDQPEVVGPFREQVLGFHDELLQLGG